METAQEADTRAPQGAMAADSRQPVKPLQFNSTTVGMSQISPHDSLAVGSSNSKGGTGYFLRFNDTERHDSSPVKKEYKPLPVVKKPAASPKKPIASPKRPITSPKKTNSSPKKITSKSKETMITGKTTPLSKTTSSPKKTPPPTASKPKGYTAKQFSASTSAMPRTPKVFNHSTSVTKANSNAKSTVTSPKKQGPAVKPKPDMKAKSKIPSARASGFTTRGRAAKPIVKDGFRTRSVSPKVLKKEDVLASQQYREETITYVADKCSQLLKNLETDREHISKSLPMPSSSLISFEFNSPTILTNGSIATATDSGSAETDAAHFVNIETPVLSAVISYSNGPHLGSEVNTDEMDTKEAVSADIPTNTSPIADTDEKEKPIEEITSVQATNDIANDSPAASGSSQPIIFENLNKRTNNYSNNNSSDGSDSGETSRLVEARVFIDLDENNQVNNLPAHCPKDSDSELTSLKGAQEAEVEDSLNRRSQRNIPTEKMNQSVTVI
ncbi:probable serine/threonine-protein kinase nek3 [Watersipora subatra]|uniref:probable serine/threonine-protein kinase nek3 n=1 Tax=Watersipora subatra TaxID=2589382 RepID=UPI00355B34FA